MKTIILVRHAKSSWKDPSLNDFDRPLNKRGKRNAPFMGQKLKEGNISPDLILSSPAKRARKTASVIAKTIGYPKKKIVLNPNMYHCSGWYLFEMMRNQDDKNDAIMIFGHNPGFNDFADLLLERNPVYNIPTTGIYCIRFNVDSWKEIQEGKGESVFFDYPKRYSDS
ncbi:histidine phosphatase family protein [Thermodesulfobacteriota bacterium]